MKNRAPDRRLVRLPPNRGGNHVKMLNLGADFDDLKAALVRRRLVRFWTAPAVVKTAVRETVCVAPSDDAQKPATVAVMNKDDVLATLRAHEAELKRAGIARLSVFGSVARGETGNDVDLLAQ